MQVMAVILDFSLWAITKQPLARFSLDFYRNDGNLIENLKKYMQVMATILDFSLGAITKELLERFSLDFHRNDGNFIENLKKCKSWWPFWILWVITKQLLQRFSLDFHRNDDNLIDNLNLVLFIYSQRAALVAGSSGNWLKWWWAGRQRAVRLEV